MTDIRMELMRVRAKTEGGEEEEAVKRGNDSGGAKRNTGKRHERERRQSS